MTTKTPHEVRMVRVRMMTFDFKKNNVDWNKYFKLPDKDKQMANAGWHVEFDAEFMRDLDCMPPDVQDAVHEIIEGLKDGSIDPLKDGIRSCGYCGGDISDAPLGINSCEKCLNELR